MRSHHHRLCRRPGRGGIAGALTCAVFALACSEDVSPVPPRSGSRLRLVDYVFEDGSRAAVRATFFDDALKERCRPTEFSDGERYCMPEAAAGDVVFGDGRCTQPRGYLAAGQLAPSYFIGHFASVAALPTRIYRAGQQIVAPTLVWRRTDSTCVASEVATTGTYYNVTETAHELARIRETSRIAGSRIDVGVDSSDDGLAAFGDFYDRELGTCDPFHNPNVTEAVCVPRSTGFVNRFADAACEQPVALMSPFFSIEHAIRQDGTTGCWSLFDVGAVTQISSAYEHADTQCLRASIASTDEVHETAPSAHELARLPRAIAEATGRISSYELVNGTLHIPGQWVFDHELGAECNVENVGGELRCVPLEAAAVSGVFADSQCSTTIDVAYVREGSCFPPGHFARRGDIRYPILSLRTHPIYQLDPSGPCNAFTPPVGYGTYSLGPPLSPAAYARVTIEPQR